MSNKINKNFLLLWMLMIGVGSGAVEFTAHQFSSEHQFALYRSWLAYGKYSTQVPTRFFPTCIESDFSQDAENSTVVKYQWQHRKITSQQEVVPLLHQVTSSSTKDAVNYFEEWLYRLHSQDSLFVLRFYHPEIMQVQWDFLTNDAAVSSLRKTLSDSHSRLHIYDFSLDASWLVLRGNAPDGGEITFRIDTSLPIAPMVQKMHQAEEQSIHPAVRPLPSTRRFRRPAAPTSLKPVPAETVDVSAPTHQEITPSLHARGLFEYISSTYKQERFRELLHNKIPDFEKFLQEDFPRATITRNGAIYTISPQDSTLIPGDIAIEVNRRKDGYFVHPASTYSMEGSTFTLPSGETFSLAALTPYQQTLFRPLLARFIYQHRAIGSRLFNFLLEQNNSPVTLVVRGAQEGLFQPPSYASLLLMLNSYLQGWRSYYTIGDIRCIDGGIEFRGFLTLMHPEKKIEHNAEIYYRMNNDCKVTLILMTLHINEG